MFECDDERLCKCFVLSSGFGLNLWIPELLLRMQGRDCSSTLPEQAKLFNATNIAWKDLPKKYDNFATEVDRFNGSTKFEESREPCDGEIDQTVSILVFY